MTDDRPVGLMTLFMTVGAVALLLPAALFVVECLAALLPARRPQHRATARPAQSVVLVPAHNEQSELGATLTSLKRSCDENVRIVVIADNCTDRTADIARSAGVECIERTDPDQRGKGYALEFGIAHLSSQGDAPDVVIIVDADCRVAPDALTQLTDHAMTTGRPVQADYILTTPHGHTPKSAISALAIIVNNRVRPRGLQRLGLPCRLTGSGMAFPFEVLKKAPPAGAYLVEDMLLGIELAKLGHPPVFCSRAEVTSRLPEGDAAAEGQRRRWEHGHLTTLLAHGPDLVREGWRRRSVALLAMGLDVLVPPMALLVLLLSAALMLAVVAGVAGVGWVPAVILAGGLGSVVLAVVLSWAAFARQTLSLKDALTIPAYVAWKVPLYLSFALRQRQATWERTARREPSPHPQTGDLYS